MGSALIFGGKDVENRRRPTSLWGPTIIQAGKSLEWFTPEICAWTHERWPECPEQHVRAMHEFNARRGMAIGVVYFDRGWDHERQAPPARFARSRWITGRYCYPILEARPITPFRLRGQQGPYTVPAAECPQEVLDIADEMTARYFTEGSPA